MGRAIGGSLVLLACLLLLTGCWSRREIDRVALVLTAGVDRAEAGVLLTVQFPVPRGGGSQSSSATVSATGRTLDEAIHTLLQRSGRFISWTHLQTLMISADYAGQGIGDLLDFLMRVPEVTERARLVVADGSAADLVAATVPGEPQSGLGFRQILVSGRREGFTPWVELVEFSGRLLEPGIAPVAALARRGPSGTPDLAGVAVFRGDRLAGFLSAAETRGFMSVREQGQHLEVPLSCPGSGKPAFLRVDGRQARVNPVMRGGVPATYDVVVRLTAHPSVLPCRGALTATALVAQVERAASERVRRDIVAALGRARQMRSDIFGLGRAAYRRGAGPAAEDAWRRVPVQVTVQMTIGIEGVQVEPPVGGGPG